MGEASGFGPKRKYVEKAIDKTSLELEGLERKLPAVAFSNDSRYVDREWERAISRTEQRWTVFCEAYPLFTEPVLGSETPRSIAEGDATGEGFRSVKPSATLMFDDLAPTGENEEEANGPSPRLQPGAPDADRAFKGRSSNSRKLDNRRHESRGRKSDAKDSPTKALPKRSPGPPGIHRTARPPPKAAFDASTKSLSAGKDPTRVNEVTNPSSGQQASGEDATALLARLDALTKTMDTTLSQAGSFSRPPARCPSKAPPPPRKPAVPPARRRGSAV